MEIVAKTETPARFHPFCKECGWRKGGVDSWDGSRCKCGHSEPPLRRVEDQTEQTK